MKTRRVPRDGIAIGTARSSISTVFGVLALLAGVFSIPGRAEAAAPTGATFVVNAIDDSVDQQGCDAGHCSLREAIQAANATPGADTIEFLIPAPGVQTISPLSSLPTVTDPVTIDGTTQPDFRASPVIELDGSLAGNGANGLAITAGNSTVRGLAINRFKAVGIEITSGGSDLIEGNYIGTDPSGLTDLGNGFGIFVGTAGNIIGGTAAGARNVVSGNDSSGLWILGSGATNNQVLGNYIGTNAAGTADLGNSFAGVNLGAPLNIIGGTAAGARNLISGNSHGVRIDGAGTANNQVLGNYIGTDATGTADLGNDASGVFLVLSAHGNTVGGTDAGARNVISGNGSAGVTIDGSGTTNNLVLGNFIGTDVTGTADLGNDGDGVTLVFSPSGNTIGATSAQARNVISGNGVNGVTISGTGASGNHVFGNYIGTDVTGATSLGNGFEGISLQGPDNAIGDPAAGAGNVISGNGSSGIQIIAANNRVFGNYIGTDATGSADLGNFFDGIEVLGSSTTIGGTAAGAGNVISGNGHNGIDMIASNSQVLGNYIGTDAAGGAPIGNNFEGLHLGGSGNTVGAPGDGAGNTIAFNGSIGVSVIGGSDNSVRRNSIFSNGALGIDLGADGPTLNDGGDSDTGPNNLQNFPVLTLAASSGGSTAVQGTLNSVSFKFFWLDFYADDQCDASGYGEGQSLLGWTGVLTDANGNAAFDESFQVALAPGQVVTATATDSVGNTSEFSACQRTAPRADLSISKDDSPNVVTAGENVTYTITVDNHGPNAATNVGVSDPLPKRTVFVSVSASQGTCDGGSTVVCDLGTISRDGSATITIVARTTTAGSIKNTAVVDGSEADSNLANNTASAVTIVRKTQDGCTVVGTSGDDYLAGTKGDDVICGLGGNDTLVGGKGNDVIRGGEGNDALYGGPGNDTLQGEGGNDTAIGDLGADTLQGGEGDDTLKAKDKVSGNDSVDGGPGTDACKADPGDTVTGCP